MQVQQHSTTKYSIPYTRTICVPLSHIANYELHTYFYATFFVTSMQVIINLQFQFFSFEGTVLKSVCYCIQQQMCNRFFETDFKLVQTTFSKNLLTLFKLHFIIRNGSHLEVVKVRQYKGEKYINHFWNQIGCFQGYLFWFQSRVFKSDNLQYSADGTNNSSTKRLMF